MKRLLYAFFLISILSSCSTREGKTQNIEDWTKLHAADTNFIDQARLLIDSVAEHSPDDMEGFVRRIADALCLEGREHKAASIAAYPHGIDLSGEEYSEIGHRLLTQLQLSGRNAPPLPIEEDDLLILRNNGFIALFFESDCVNCHNMIKELKQAHDSLVQAGIKVVSIASDVNPDIYNAYAADLPWKDKYCDYRSFSGDYFNLWGVASTPTMYFVNYKGIVKGRYYSLNDIKERNK